MAKGQIKAGSALQGEHTSLCVLLAAATAEAACCWSTSWRALSCCSCIVRATAQAYACTQRQQMAMQHELRRRYLVAMNNIPDTHTPNLWLRASDGDVSCTGRGVAGGRGLS